MTDRYVLLMTATVRPGDYANQISRYDSQLRMQDYIRSLQFWLDFPDQRLDGIVFCENTNCNLEPLSQVVLNSRSGRECELLTFDGNERPSDVHYGYAELGSIDYAIRHSKLLNRNVAFVKATGRLVFPRLSNLLDNLTGDLSASVDCRRAYVGEGGYQIRARTELMVFAVDFYKQTLFEKRGEMLGDCSHVEEFIAKKLWPLYTSNVQRVQLRWRVECMPSGFGAWDNSSYESRGKQLKSKLRGFARKLLPALWL